MSDQTQKLTKSIQKAMAAHLGGDTTGPVVKAMSLLNFRT